MARKAFVTLGMSCTRLTPLVVYRPPRSADLDWPAERWHRRLVRNLAVLRLVIAIEVQGCV